MARKHVVVTGAAGYIAGKVLPALSQRYDLTLLDARGTDRQGNPVEGVEIVEVKVEETVAEWASYRE